MKFYAAFALVLLVAGLTSAQAQQEADDQYIAIYGLVQQADTFVSSGRVESALTLYTDVQKELLGFQKSFPAWNPKIINFRLNYVAEKIAGLKTQTPEPKAPAPVVAAPVAVAPSAPPPAAPQPEAGVADDLRAQVQALQAANTTLQAKLKEALAAQPAAVDSRELAKAQAKISTLMKENELIKVSLEQGKTQTNSLAVAAQTEALKQAQLALTEANQKLSVQLARADQLAQENQTLQTRLQTALADPGALDAVRAENGLLKKHLADLEIAVTNASSSEARLTADLKQAQLQAAALQSDAQVRQLEKLALENKLKIQSAAKVGVPVGPAPAVPSADQLNNEARIRELTEERNSLLAKLGAANKELYGAKKQNTAAQIGDLNDQIKTLRGRLAVDEAQAVPYTPEELALFNAARAATGQPGAGKEIHQGTARRLGPARCRGAKFFCPAAVWPRRDQLSTRSGARLKQCRRAGKSGGY